MIGQLATPTGPEFIVRNEQARRIGMIQPGTDRFGNKIFVTRSVERDDTLTTFTEGAARYWLWSLDETHGGRRMRGGRDAS